MNFINKALKNRKDASAPYKHKYSRFLPAFTLMEFIVTAGLIAFLAVMAAHELARTTLDNKIERVVWQVKLITEALERYHTDNTNFSELTLFNTLCTSQPRYLAQYICNHGCILKTPSTAYVLANNATNTITLKIPVDTSGTAESLKSSIQLQYFGSVASIDVYPEEADYKVWVNYDLAPAP